MAFNFVGAPFSTDLPELLDLENNLIKRGESKESYASWVRISDGYEVINIRQTISGGYCPTTTKKVDGVVDEATFIKFVEKHFKGDVQALVKKMGMKLANDGWLCITLHQRPDENVKMEWLANKQLLLTINIAV